jgi:hypothetical protein
MKYKRLSAEELKELEKEFIHFLSSAQITGPDWEKMKKEEPLHAEELIEVFSDMVYEKVMGKIEYLEFRDEHNLNIFHYGKDRVEMAGLSVKPGSGIDLRLEDAMRNWDGSGVNVLRTEKEYVKDRGVEIFEMLESGCLITDNRLFELIKELA